MSVIFYVGTSFCHHHTRYYISISTFVYDTLHNHGSVDQPFSPCFGEDLELFWFPLVWIGMVRFDLRQHPS